jgi:hypothetical protein
MAITPTSKIYTDVFGTTRNFYRANSGDIQYIEYQFEESIMVQTSGSVVLQLNPIQNIVTWLGGSFADEGFRIGDTVRFSKYSAGGVLMNQWTTQVTNVVGADLDVNSIPTWYDTTAGQIMQIVVINRPREGMRLNLNFVANGSTGNEFSLFDGEATTYTFDLTTGTGVYYPLQVGKKSGMYFSSVRLVLTSQTQTTRYYSLEMGVIQFSIYDSNPFSYANCLKFYVKMKWESLLGETFNNLVTVISDDADTGWFDEAYNQDLINASIVQPITAIDYSQQTYGSFVIDSLSTEYAFGCGYVSQDDTYRKNRYFDQSELCMVIPSTVPIIGNVLTSPTNPAGAYFDFQITNINSNVQYQTVDFVFTPSPAFTNFIESLPEQDRYFYVWAKYGNMNLLVFNGLLTKIPAEGGPIKMRYADYLDHHENTTTGSGVELGYEANIEDDLAFVGGFEIPYDSICDTFVAKIVALDTNSDESFVLQQTTFNFNSVPQVAGKYILNLVSPVFSQFQTTSLKRDALLELDSSIDGDGYGVKIYFPFLLRWEYWLQQLNADADFYPNEQTRNWLPYDTTNDWTLCLKLELIQDQLLYDHVDKDLKMKDYDSNERLKNWIELYIDSPSQLVDAVIENSMMRVVSYHEHVNGDIWELESAWGMITVEPTENSPRWWCSTHVDYDNNTLNPLKPLTGLLCSKSLVTPSIIKLECFFDPSKINLENGVKFTSKIKGCLSTGKKAKRTTRQGIKMTTQGGIKEIN